MEYIAKSRTAMALAVLAAFVFVLSAALEVAAYAALTPASFGASADLGRASGWLRFASGLAALAAVCAAGWELVLRKAWAGAAEATAGAAGTLLLAIGLLISASSDQQNSAAKVVSAIGIGVWALLVLSRAARTSLAEQAAASQGTAVHGLAGEGGARESGASAGAATLPRQSLLWLVASIGLIVLAVGFGFTLDANSKSIGITSGVLEAAGTVILLGALGTARVQGLLPSRAAAYVLAGLAILAAAFAAVAVVAGVVFGPDITLTGLRVGLSVTSAIQLLAIAVLGLAAWTRLGELVVAPAP